MSIKRQKAGEAMLSHITACQSVLSEMARIEPKFKPYAKKSKKILADAYSIIQFQIWDDWVREAVPKYEALMKKYARAQRKKV